MVKSNLTKITLTLVGVLLLMTACGGYTSAEKQTQNLEPTPTLVSVGSIMEKPVPYGYDIILEDIVISVNEINRPADAIITESSGEIPAPANGQEYLLVNITNQCVKPGQGNCYVGFSDYQLIDSTGNIFTPESSASGMAGFFAFEEFSSGTSNRGYLAFLVDQGADYPMLTYKTFHGANVYLSLAY